MKIEHKIILDLLHIYFSQNGAEDLRFWQGLYNCGIIRSETFDTGVEVEQYILDDYNISDEKLIKKLKDGIQTI